MKRQMRSALTALNGALMFTTGSWASSPASSKFRSPDAVATRLRLGWMQHPARVSQPSPPQLSARRETQRTRSSVVLAFAAAEDNAAERRQDSDVPLVASLLARNCVTRWPSVRSYTATQPSCG